jgi:MerR family redox-sensitive transcriptional activator SoxR
MIGEVAAQSGFSASAIRYWERIGVLSQPRRIGGRRQYHPAVLERLAVVERAIACGFSLAEVRQLLLGFREGTPPSERWQTLARKKIAELDELARKIAATKELLLRPCTCADLGECGRWIRARKGQAREG